VGLLSVAYLNWSLRARRADWTVVWR
jgi:hypothetical protein